MCKEIKRNKNVVSVRYAEKDGTLLPITVYTYEDLQRAEDQVSVQHVIFGCIYSLEAMAVLVFYFKKRAK